MQNGLLYVKVGRGGHQPPLPPPSASYNRSYRKETWKASKAVMWFIEMSTWFKFQINHICCHNIHNRDKLSTLIAKLLMYVV